MNDWERHITRQIASLTYRRTDLEVVQRGWAALTPHIPKINNARLSVDYFRQCRAPTIRGLANRDIRERLTDDTRVVGHF